MVYIVVQPVLGTTSSASSITQSTATLGGNITAQGSSAVTARGVCYSTSANPTIADSHTSDGTGIGTFTSNLTGLASGTTYYVRSYATSTEGTSYGSQVTFTTTAKPTLNTTTIGSITQTTATSGGNITDAGGLTITARGVCWSTSANPTISNSHTTNGTGTGAFSSSLTGLTSGTTYYVRAYATNSVGTAYGSQTSFKTTTLPTVSVPSIASIDTTTARADCIVDDTGGLTVTARGVCWSTGATPTISNSHTSNGSGSGAFTSNLTGLTAYTLYYVRAYATNSIGTAYGSQTSFTTLFASGITTYTTTGSHTFTLLAGATSLQYLIVAGGGAGGGDISGGAGGGGGGGGYLTGTVSNPVAGSYTAVVGAGGTGNGYNNGNNGNNSSIAGTSLNLTAHGGGGGGAGYTSGINHGLNGSGGGSGGGAGGNNGTSGGSVITYGGNGTSGEGHNGGNGGGNTGSAGGGGGAGGNGTAGSGGGNGGVGTSNSISGNAVTYGIGGAGNNAVVGAANTGNGGGGAYSTSGYAGGSGIIILKYS